MNEWTNSLYSSRQRRYAQRSVAVQHCIDVYLAQYEVLGVSIVEERNALLDNFMAIKIQMIESVGLQKDYFQCHLSFIHRGLERSLRRLDRSFSLLQDLMKQYQRHCGTIKRFGQEKVRVAREKLN